MSDLPDRTEIARIETALLNVGLPDKVMHVLRDYADGVLRSRDEMDEEAMRQVLVEWAHELEGTRTSWHAVKDMLDAVWGVTDEAT